MLLVWEHHNDFQMYLDSLAIKYGTDKSSRHHGMTAHYDRHFKPIRATRLMIWNGGFGGYEYPDRGGGDSLMWAEYFPESMIIVTDIHAKSDLNHPRIKFRRGDQGDEAFWNKMLGDFGQPDIFIDDMSHVNSLTIKTFEIVFPMVKKGGLYVIEDIETSWYPDYGFGGTKDLDDMQAPTTINMARKLLNEINSKYNGAEVRYGIKAMHFYPNMIVIEKL